MATIAFTSAALSANGHDLTITWTDVSWGSTFTVDTADFTNVTVAGANARTLAYDVTAVAAAKATDDVTITVRLDGWVDRDETITLNLAEGFITDESANVSAASVDDAITNSSTQRSYVSLDDLGTQVGITTPTVDEYTELDRHAQSAIDRVARAIGMPSGIHKQTHTEDFDGQDYHTALLGHWPVVSVTSIKSRDTSGGLTTLESTTYRTDNSTGRVHRLSGSDSDDSWFVWSARVPALSSRALRRPLFREGFQNYQAIFVAGYTPQTIPDNLVGATTAIAADLKNVSGSDSSMNSETMGSYSYTRKTATELSESFATTISLLSRREIL